MSAPDLGPDFYDAWTAAMRRLGLDPLAVARVAFAESGMRATSYNAGSNAGGLIGFMPFILKGLGWTGTPEEFRQLSATEQVPYVEAFYRPYAGQLQGADEGLVYVANFLPGRISRAKAGQPVTQAGESYYDQNTVLDPDHTGEITMDTLKKHLALQDVGARYQTIESELLSRGAGESTNAASPSMWPWVILGGIAFGGWYFHEYGTPRWLSKLARI